MPVVILGAAITILALLAWTGAVSMQSVYRQSFGAAIRWLAQEFTKQRIHIGPFKVHPLRFAGNALDSFDHTIQNGLGHIAAFNGGKIAKYLINIALLWSGVGYVVEKLAFQTLQSFSHVRHVTIPKAIRARVLPLQGQVGRIKATQTAIAHDTIPRVGRRARTAEQEAHSIGRKVGALAGAVGAALIGAPSAALDWPRAKVGTKPRADTGLRSRVKSLERLLAGAGVAALVWAGLRTLSLRWLRCWKVNKLGRGLCGMNPHWFNDILGLLTDFLILRSICDIIGPVETAAKDVGVPLVELLTRAESFVNCSNDRADDLPPLTLHLATEA